MKTRSTLLSRRMFLPGSAALAVGLTTARLASADDVQPLARVSGFPQMPTGFSGVTPCGSYAPPAEIASFGRIAPAKEPGEALQISGVIYQHGGKKPASDVKVFAYHTDARGRYNTPNTPFRPRLFGWVKSDAQGRYGFATIKPAPYPELDTPTHIHVSLYAADLPEYWVDDYWFAGDPLITPRQRGLLTGRGGGGETLRLVRGSDGVLRGKRDFILEHVQVSGGCKLYRS
jgi:protocatechuate 3,4-dioxygenase beta subunit